MSQRTKYLYYHQHLIAHHAAWEWTFPYSGARLEEDVAEEPPVELRKQIFPTFARERQRAANTAYWKDNLTETPENLPVNLQMQIYPNFARTQQRTANQVYWHDNLLAVDEVVPDVVGL